MGILVRSMNWWEGTLTLNEAEGMDVDGIILNSILV